MEHILVKLLCELQLLNETLDELKDTNVYKQQFKQKTNSYEKDITLLYSDHISSIYNINQKAVESIITGIEAKVDEIVKMTNMELAEYTLKKNKPTLGTTGDPNPDQRM